MEVEIDHPVAGRIKNIGVPVKLSDTPGSIRFAAPTLGQHTDAILCELGFNSDEIAKMHESGAVVSNEVKSCLRSKSIILQCSSRRTGPLRR